MRPSYTLFDRNTKAFVYGFQTNAIQRMLDFDYICKRDGPSIAAIINPSRAGIHKAFWGTKEIIIPMFRTIPDAAKAYPDADVMVNFASHRSAFDTSMEALEQPSIKTVAVIAEGVPERQSGSCPLQPESLARSLSVRQLLAAAQEPSDREYRRNHREHHRIQALPSRLRGLCIQVRWNAKRGL
jgi:hypothetical protein